MGYQHLLEAIDGRDVILDECVWFYGLPDFLENNGLNWARFPQSTPDDKIVEFLKDKPNQVILTCDIKLTKRLGGKAIRIPYTRNQGGPKKSYKEIRQIEEMKHKLSVDEFLRDWEQSNDLNYKIMRGMRMLFCERRGNRSGSQRPKWKPI